MKKILLVLLLAATFRPCVSQLNITGKVVDMTRQAIPGATVSFMQNGVLQGGNTDRNGSFDIKLSQTGSYIMEISCVGFATYIQTIQFSTYRTYDMGMIHLEELVQELQTVEVVGRVQRDYSSDYSFSATKVAIKNKDLPQSISTVTKELISDRQAFQLSDAIKIASGVIPNSYYNQFAIRGISQNEEGTIVNGMRTRQYYFSQPLTSNIERIEVIKGPASATFSSVDPGGSINLVTKKPLVVPRKEISLSAGSFSTMRGTLDFTGPMNDRKTLLYRINAAYQEGKSFRDLQGQQATLVSPSFSYIPNNKTAINTELIYSNIDGKIDRGQPIFGAVAGQTDLKSTPVSFALNATNDYFRSKEVILTGSIAHSFSDHIAFNAAYMKQSWTEDLLEHRTTNRFAVDIHGVDVPTLAAMQVIEREQYWDINNLNTYINFNFSFGKTKNKFLAGYDLHSWQKLKGGGQNAARGYLLNDGTVSASYDPARQGQYQIITVNGVEMPAPNVEHFDLADPSYTIKTTNDYVFGTRTALPAALTTTHAAYFQEHFTLSDLSILIGLRYEWFKDITGYESSTELIVRKEKLLPRVGITYAVTKNINVYATYLEGYQPQSNTVNLMPLPAPSGSLFDPLISDLKEVGMKADIMRKRIHVTASIYEINQENILMNANDPVNPDLLMTRGAERSRGIEMDVAGYILTNWQINASYSYISAKILEDSNPELVGARKQNTPVNSGNIWTRYNFESSTLLNDLGVGFGIQYNGDMVPWFTRDFNIPSFIILDAALYYTPAGSNFQIAFNINNLIDKTYWIGAQNYLRLFPGAPRNVMLTATYKF